MDAAETCRDAVDVRIELEQVKRDDAEDELSGDFAGGVTQSCGQARGHREKSTCGQKNAGRGVLPSGPRQEASFRPQRRRLPSQGTDRRARRNLLVVVDVFPVLQERCGHCPRLAVGPGDGRGAVLGQVNAAHVLGLVGAAAMEDEAVEGDDAAGGDDDRVAGSSPV